jgi:sortase (surface protein transpeptidase)
VVTRLLATLALLLALAGCAVPTTPTPTGSTSTADVPVSATVPAPVAVEIPAIGAVSSLIGLGLNPDGSLAVPPLSAPRQASWYSDGVTPGETGPAVVAGHVSGQIDGRSIPGVFARLAELGPGDDILIERSDGTTLRFVVQRVETHDKGDFPTEAVYGDRAGPELVLITCGGALDPAARSYESNVIVFAVLA